MSNLYQINKKIIIKTLTKGNYTMAYSVSSESYILNTNYEK